MHRRQRRYLQGLALATALVIAGYLVGASSAARGPVAALLCATGAYSAARFQARARKRGGRAGRYGLLSLAAGFIGAIALLAWLAAGRQANGWLGWLGGAVVVSYAAGCLIGAKGRGKGRAFRGEAEAAGRMGPKSKGDVVDAFHRRYYESAVVSDTRWLGVRAVKCPLDLWVYQEIIHEVRPDAIVESGTARGGSALFLATICELVENGRVISIDIEEEPERPEHPRITYVHGSSTDPRIVERVRGQIAQGERVMVLLDSDHNMEHVLRELRIYGELVTRGSYLIVEDTNIGHPVEAEEAGPMEAVEEFLRENEDFAVDESREKFHLTFNPNGYLKKLR